MVKTVGMITKYYTGRDLEKWELDGSVFEITEESFGKKDFWVPGMHVCKDKFCLFESSFARSLDNHCPLCYNVINQAAALR